jgi:predicted metal-dependent phosphotriesterase family hydrolase
MGVRIGSAYACLSRGGVSDEQIATMLEDNSRRWLGG